MSNFNPMYPTPEMPGYYNGYNMYSTQPAPAQQLQQQLQYAFVNGYEGAKAFNLPANQSMLLMDSAEPVCYKKSVDGFGQFTIKAYKLVEYDPSIQPNQNGMNTNNMQQAQQPAYVTQSDFDALSKKVDSLFKMSKSQKVEKE